MEIENVRAFVPLPVWTNRCVISGCDTAQRPPDHGMSVAAHEEEKLMCGEALVEWARGRGKVKSERAMSRVTPEGLYVGGWMAASERENLDARRIAHVVNVGGGECRFDGAGVEYLFLGVRDRPDAQLLPYLEDAAAFVRRGLAGHGGVLVHCRGGISRSPTVVLAYLVRYRGLSLAQAQFVVACARPPASPNAGFMDQLAEFERRVLGAEARGPAAPPPQASKKGRQRAKLLARKAKARGGRHQ